MDFDPPPDYIPKHLAPFLKADLQEIAPRDLGYEGYIAWLAEHLATTDYELPEEQVDIARPEEDKKPELTVIGFGFDLAISDFTWEFSEEDGLKGVPYEAFRKSQLDWLNRGTVSPEELRETWGVEKVEDLVMSKEDYKVLQRDAFHKESIEDALSGIPIDLPYRGILKRILDTCTSAEHRYKVLKRFFDEYNETASK